MISFSLIADDINFEGIDTLLFTSKQAVISADTIDKSWKQYPSVAIGDATKRKIEELGGEVIYTPKNFYGESLAKDIEHYFSTKKLLYLRPKIVSFDSKSYLERAGISIKEEILYETSCSSYNRIEKPKNGAVIIFTSPSTIKCFFKSFKWQDDYTAVLIGEATKAHLPKKCRFFVAERPLIDSCVEKALEIVKK